MKRNEEKQQLTKDEEKRLAAFTKRAARLAEDGYTQKELTVSSGRANIVGPLYGLALAIPFIGLLIVFHKPGSFGESLTIGRYFGFVAAILLAIPVHELIHGLTFCLFTKGKFKSISFGFNRQALAPYCTCTEALTKRQYLIGLLAPCLLLGVVPGIAAVILDSVWVLLFSAVMLMSAGGDLLIARLLLRHRAEGETLYFDHPTKIGLTCFEK